MTDVDDTVDDVEIEMLFSVLFSFSVYVYVSFECFFHFRPFCALFSFYLKQ